jgi:hypothetical protein
VQKFLLDFFLTTLQLNYQQQIQYQRNLYTCQDYLSLKSFLLSLYCMLRIFFLPERKVVVVGAAFRQSKVLYEYAEGIWRNASVVSSDLPMNV